MPGFTVSNSIVRTRITAFLPLFGPIFGASRGRFHGFHAAVLLWILAVVCVAVSSAQAATSNNDLITEEQLRNLGIPTGSANDEGSQSVGKNVSGDRSIVQIGPGFGATWLSNNELAYAVPAYKVRNTYPYNDIVIKKLRWYRPRIGSSRDLISIPIGNGKSETAIHFVYESFNGHYGYVLSNADDRHGSAHGLQVGVVDADNIKPRVYLEASYYHATGYEDIRGVSLSPDTKGFVASYKGDLYYVPFGVATAREPASVSSLFQDSYAPYFDDTSIKARQLRKGGNNFYPQYLSEHEILLYDGNNILRFNTNTGDSKSIINVGEDVSGMSVSPDGKRVAVMQAGSLLIYQLTGELDKTIDLGINTAQYPSWNPNGRDIAFDDGKTLYVKMLQTGHAPVTSRVKPRSSKPVPVKQPQAQVPAIATSTIAAAQPNVCHTTQKLVNIRLLLEAEISVLSSKVDPALLNGLKEVSKDMQSLIDCQKGQQ